MTLNSNWTSPTLENSKGRLTEATTTTASGSLQTALVYGYDSMGRITNFWQCMPYNCGGTPFGMTYNYDLAGDVTGYSGPDWFTVDYGVNSDQQQTSMTWGGNEAVSSISYTPWGAISQICGGASCSDSQETIQYNNRLQPVLMELGNSGGASADYCLVYNYYQGAAKPTSCAVPSAASGGNDGSVLDLWYQDNVNTSYSHTTNYSYDTLGRLSEAKTEDFSGNTLWNRNYTYDQYGNLTCGPGSANTCNVFNVDSPTNQIISIVPSPSSNPTDLSYDAAGELLYDGNENYTYDAEGRVISATNSGPEIPTRRRRKCSRLSLSTKKVSSGPPGSRGWRIATFAVCADKDQERVSSSNDEQRN